MMDETSDVSFLQIPQIYTQKPTNKLAFFITVPVMFFLCPRNGFDETFVSQ